MSDADTPKPVTLRQQVEALPKHIMATWRSRYVTADGVDLQARAILSQEATAIRSHGGIPDAVTVWMRLTEMVVKVGAASPELIAAAALAGLAAGLRPQGFHVSDAAKASIVEGD